MTATAGPNTRETRPDEKEARPLRSQTSVQVPATAAPDKPAASLACRRLLTRSIDDTDSSLRVGVVDAGDTGTMDYAEQVQLQVPGLPSWTQKVDVERGELPPLLRRRVRAGANRELLLGWSSFGGGRQTMVAWLVTWAGGVRLVDELRVVQPRGNALLLARKRGGTLQVGVPPPSDQGEPLDGPWLKSTRFRLPVEQAGDLRYEPLHPDDPVEAFCPPFAQTAAPTRVAWLSIAAKGFVVGPRTVTAR